MVMRLLWLDLMGEGGGEVEEPVVGWEAEAAGAPGQAANELREWLFGKEGRDEREGRGE